jgi:hypothetical protein
MILVEMLILLQNMRHWLESLRRLVGELPMIQLKYQSNRLLAKAFQNKKKLERKNVDEAGNSYQKRDSNPPVPHLKGLDYEAALGLSLDAANIAKRKRRKRYLS